MLEKFNKNNIEQMNIIDYLNSKGIHFVKEFGDEIVAHCPFCGGDDDSRDNEGHFYINKPTGTYYCHKCSVKGNKTTLAQHFGDWEKTTWTSWVDRGRTTAGGSNPPMGPDGATEPKREPRTKPIRAGSNDSVAKNCAKRLTNPVKEYLNERGLNNCTIESAQLGQGNIYGQEWITIPVRGLSGEIDFLKLRCLPGDEEKGAKYKNYSSTGSNEATLYGGYELRKRKPETIIITEGEFDALIARQNGLPMTVSSTAGAGTFKEEWLACFEYVREIYVCLDNDEKGRIGAEKILRLFKDRCPNITVYRTTYPGNIKDMTEYFLAEHTAEDLLAKYSEYVAGPKPIDVSELGEIGIDELADVLDTTIKFDKHNKVVVFLAMLTAYTESDQLNVYLNGPSSSGKTYIMQEVAKYFPEEDKIMLADASPNAFKHQEPVIDPKTGQKYVDLERKLLLFQDVPCYQLQENLRPLLSHDKKEIRYLTTDKNKSQQQVAKESIIRGYPVSITCSANLRMDEQEKTRSILLSPEVSQEKIDAGKELASERSANPSAFDKNLENDKERQRLMARVRYIKQKHIDSVIVPNPEKVLATFNAISKTPAPSQQREIAHFYSLIKAVAMLNAHRRLNEDETTVVANEHDLDTAATLWKELSKASSLGVPPYLQNFYYDYILPAWRERQREAGVSREEIRNKFFNLTGNFLNDDKLRKDYIPALKYAGAISEVKDEEDKKTKLVIPLIDIATESDQEESLLDAGIPVDIKEEDIPF